MDGSRAALPFWADFMKTVYDSMEIVEGSFPGCSGIVEVEICDETKKIATPYCPNSYKEVFNMSYQPNETCDVHTGPQLLQQRRRRRF